MVQGLMSRRSDQKVKLTQTVTSQRIRKMKIESKLEYRLKLLNFKFLNRINSLIKKNKKAKNNFCQKTTKKIILK